MNDKSKQDSKESRSKEEIKDTEIQRMRRIGIKLFDRNERRKCG